MFEVDCKIMKTVFAFDNFQKYSCPIMVLLKKNKR